MLKLRVPYIIIKSRKAVQDGASGDGVVRFFCQWWAIIKEDSIKVVLVVEVLDTHCKEVLRHHLWAVIAPVSPTIPL